MFSYNLKKNSPKIHIYYFKNFSKKTYLRKFCEYAPWGLYYNHIMIIMDHLHW